MQDAMAKLQKGLWNLSAEERKAVYQDLRQALGLKESEPLLPLPESALKALCKRTAELMAQGLSRHPATQPLANAQMLEGILLQYGLPPVDAFFESHLGPAQGMAQGGMPGLYLHILMNTHGLQSTFRAARELLTPEQQQLVHEHLPRALFLRHALLQEGSLGAGTA